MIIGKMWRLATLAAAVLLAVGCVTMPGKSSSSGEGDPAADGKAAEPGLIGNMVDSVKEKVTGVREKPQILDIKPGPYEKSNEALGDERDIYDKKITYGLVDLPAFADYANGVLDKLKQASGVTGIPGKVHVVATDQLDAMASADGNIYISIGYARSLESEDELAALLGHELSHVLLRHHDSNFFSRMQKQLSVLVLSAIQVRGALDSTLGKSNGGATQLNGGERSTLLRMELLIQFTDKALHPAWNRRQEAEADRLGVDLLAKAGYSYASGMVPWLDKVAKWDADRAQAKAVLAEQRDASLKLLTESGKLDQSIKQGLEAAFKDIVEQLSATHESGEKRREDVDAYVEKVYKNTPLPRPPVRKEPYTRMLAGRDTRNLLDGYRNTFEARKQVKDANFAAAWALLQKLVRNDSAVNAHALPNHLAYESLRGLGRGKMAETYLKRSAAAKEPAWETFESAATYYRDAGKKDEVLNTGQTAFKMFSKAPSSYPRLIALYQRTGMADAAKKMLSECLLNQVDRRDECTKAARTP